MISLLVLFGAVRAELVDLSHDVNNHSLNWPVTGYQRFNLSTLAVIDEGGYFYIGKDISMTEHLATHMDAPHHFGKDNWDISQIPLEKLIAPVVKLDVKSKCEDDRDYTVTVQDLLDWESEHGSVPSGAVILVETGWGEKYTDMAEYYGSPMDTKDPELNYTQWAAEISFPGLSSELADELISNYDIAGVGVDTASLDAGKAGSFPVHFKLQTENKWGLENLCCLDKVPASGATLMAFPPKINEGSGITIRPVVDTDSRYVYRLNSTARTTMFSGVLIALLILLV